MFHAEPEPESEGAPTWKLATVDKHRFELASLREVVEQILDGRLRPDDQISRTGGHWLKLREIPEFSPLFIGHDLPRVFKVVEAAGSSELGPPPSFGTGVDEPPLVRREETVRFDLGSLRDPLPDPALPTLDEEGPLPAPPQFDSPAPRASRSQRVTGGVSSMLDAVTKAVVGEPAPAPEPEAEESEASGRPSGSVRGRSQPILVSDLARAAAQSVAAAVQRADDKRASERSERVARERVEGSERRPVTASLAAVKAAAPAASPSATSPVAAGVSAAVGAPSSTSASPPAQAAASSATASAAVASSVAATAAAATSAAAAASTTSTAAPAEVAPPIPPPRAPELVIVKVGEPSPSRGSGGVVALVAILLGIGVVFGIPSVRERVFNLGAPPPTPPPAEAKAPKVEHVPEFQAARAAIRTLGVRETSRALGGLERVIDDPARDAAVVSAAKLMQAELLLLRTLSNQITVMLDPANSQAQGAIDTDLPDAAALVDGLPADAEPGARARVVALLALAQGGGGVTIGAEVPGAREVQALILGAPLWRSREAAVPSGLITSLRGVASPSTLHQSLLALALWRSGDDDGARTVLDGVLGRVGDMPAAKALRAALDQQAAEKGEVLPPPPEPPVEPVDPTAPPTDPRPPDPTGTRPPPVRPPPVSTDQEAIDNMIKTGCEKVRGNDALGGNKLLMQAVDKRGDWRSFELCMCLGTGFSAQNNHDTALAWFKRAAQQSPHSRDALAGVARAAELAGKRLDAIEYYRKLLEVEPGNQAARNYLAKHDDSNKPPPDDIGDLLPVGKKSP